MDVNLLKKKWENIWYHYKFFIIAGIFIFGCLVYTFIDYGRSKKSDVVVTYLGGTVDDYLLSDRLENLCSDSVKDINNDKKKVFETNAILSAKDLRGDMFFWQNVDMDMVNAKSLIYFADADVYEMLKERESIVPFNISEDERTYYLDVTDNPLFKDCFKGGKRVYMCVRRDFSGKLSKEDKLYKENGEAVLKKIIENK